MQVEFKEVGRNKKSWCAEMATVNHESLVRSIREQRALMDREIDFELHGLVLAGGSQIVGRFRIVAGPSG